MKKIPSALIIAMVLALAASCSYVFSAYVNGQISGEVSGENGMPIDGARILIYDSESVRDSDYDMALIAAERGSYQNLQYRSSFQGYSVEGIVNSIRVMWETSSPAFDKDHDLHSFYVLVLKDGYYPAKTDIIVTSGAGAPAFIRIASLEQIYDSRSSINGYVSALDGTMLSGIKVYVYNDGEKAGKAKEIAAGLASLDPMGYMDDFTGEEYHSAAVTEANGRYSADVMWDGETSPSFAVLAVGNGYEPELCSIEAGVCTASSPGVQDIKLARIEKTEEVV